MRALSLLLAALSLPACAARPHTSYEANSQVLSLPGIIAYQGSSGALSYHSPVVYPDEQLTPHGRIRAEVCQQGFSVPVYRTFVSVGWGAGDYRKAVQELRRGMQPQARLHDVQVDERRLSVLGLYRKQCLELNAGVLVPTGALKSSTILSLRFSALICQRMLAPLSTQVTLTLVLVASGSSVKFQSMILPASFAKATTIFLPRDTPNALGLPPPTSTLALEGRSQAYEVPY